MPGSARRVRRDDTAIVLEAEGPALAGPREFCYRPSPSPTCGTSGELSVHLAVTVPVERGAGESREIPPRWTPNGTPALEHRTSIVWINTVIFDDVSIFEADVAPVALAWEHVTGSDFEALTASPR